MSHRHSPETTDRYACAHGGAVWTAEQLAPYHDVWSRIQPGEILPQGDCPDCGAFCDPPEPPTTPLHVWTVTYEHKQGTNTYVCASAQAALLQLGRLLLDRLAANLNAFDTAMLPEAQALLRHLEQGHTDAALYAWIDWRDAYRSRCFQETCARDEHVVSALQPIDAEQLTALRARLASL